LLATPLRLSGIFGTTTPHSPRHPDDGLFLSTFWHGTEPLIFEYKHLIINNLIHFNMPKIQSICATIHTPLLVIVDALIITTFIADWVAKRRARKAATPPAPVEDDPAGDE